MNEEGSQLLESLMHMLGENPSEKVGQMLSALTQNSTAASPQSDDAEAAEDVRPRPVTETGSKPTDDNMTGGFDPAMLLKLQRLMGQLDSREADERSALLTAIRPFLSEERRPQIDRAIKLLKLTRLARVAQEMDLFNGLL